MTLLIFPGGWPAIDYGRWEADDLYEEQLRTCRQIGHDLEAGYVAGFEVLTCCRCRTRFEEQP